MSYQVVQGSEKHLDWVLEEAAYALCVKDSGHPEYYNPENFKKLFLMGVESGTTFIVEKEGAPIGFLGALICPNMFNPELTILMKVVWYVEEEYRKSRAAYLLLKTYIEFAKSRGYRASFSIPAKELNVKVSTLKKLGFELQDHSFELRY